MTMTALKLKYLLTLTTPLFFTLSLLAEGFWAYTSFFYGFTLVPLLDIILPYSATNLDAVSEEVTKKDPFYDVLLYLMVPLQYALLILFLFQVSNAPSLFTWFGHIITFGLSCGVLGINLGHELGHRSHPWEQKLAQANLLTSLYMHFFIEHNLGHHQKVATPEDPASARYGESLYRFLVRTITDSWRSAWNLEKKNLARQNRPLYSRHNRMLIYLFCELSLIGIIFLFFGWFVTLSFILSAFIGIFLLETINYIEHYGLSRQKTRPGKYEGVRPAHSWNSEHIAGRILLFNLTRHSDHHYNARRKYQVLRYFEDGPQLPTGYPGMVLLSMIPPLWFKLMNPRVETHLTR